MSDTVIRVENLSKKYVLSHQQEGQQYKALRDVIADGAKSLLKAVNPLTQNSKLKTQNSSREEFWALKDVSFEIKQGDRVGIIGRNGAGKSTLLKVLSRIVEPTSGSISIRGRVASLLEVGTGFHPELTGRENVYLNGAILGMGREEIKRKFDEIVAFAEVEKFLDTPVKRYSSGMYVRLAFAVAAHMEPEILIVDEVLAVGDVQFQKKCLGKMEEVEKEGRTVLFVSHNMATVTHLCNKGLFLEKGKLLLQENIKACIDAYVDKAGARLGRLLDHQRVKDSSIKVIAATVNGSPNDLINLSATDNLLEIEMEIVAQQSCRMTMEVILKDREGNSLAACVPGHVDAEKYIYKITPGNHMMRSQISLPKLNKGTFRLEISLTEPGFREYVGFPFGVELQVDGFCTITGHVFEQSLTGAGFQILDGVIAVKSAEMPTYS